MDRQPNDRLGWIPPPRAFEHRRQILRGCGNTHTNTDAYTDCNSDSCTYGDSNTYRDSNANPMHRKMLTHAEAAPNASTAPLELWEFFVR